MDQRIIQEGYVQETDYALGAGQFAPIRMSRKGALYVAQAAGRYQDAVMRGKVFFACSAALHALSVDFNTTATGLILSNTAGSGTNLVLLQLRVAISSAPAGISNIMLGGYGLSVSGAVTHTTPGIVYNAKGGVADATGVGKYDEHATIPQHVCWRAYSAVVGAVALTPTTIVDDIDGAIILTPGTSCSVSAGTTAINAICSITWEEIAV